MWVRSEYAGELAVLSTWVCGLAPWAMTVSRRRRLIRVVTDYSGRCNAGAI